MLPRNAFTHQFFFFFLNHASWQFTKPHQRPGLSGIQGSLIIQYEQAKGYTWCLDLEQAIPWWPDFPLGWLSYHSKHWTWKQHSNIAQPKTDKWLSSPSHFPLFFTILTVVFVSFCSFIKRVTLKICMLYFVLINSVLLNLFCV